MGKNETNVFDLNIPGGAYLFCICGSSNVEDWVNSFDGIKRQHVKCRSCGKEVTYRITPNGKVLEKQVPMATMDQRNTNE